MIFAWKHSYFFLFFLTLLTVDFELFWSLIYSLNLKRNPSLKRSRIVPLFGAFVTAEIAINCARNSCFFNNFQKQRWWILQRAIWNFSRYNLSPDFLLKSRFICTANRGNFERNNKYSSRSISFGKMGHSCTASRRGFRRLLRRY